MSLIIPYEEKVHDNEGAFINPEGQIIFVYGKHEIFAKEFCDGKDYNFLFNVKNGLHYYSSHFEEFKKLYNFDGKKEDIDIYKSTKLTKEQLQLYKLWLKNFKYSRYSDFMIYLLGFDKVEAVMKRTITTANSEPHIRFYNYYLMDWHIDHQVPMKYNKDTECFEYDKKEDWLINFDEDREVENEINEIRSKVLLKDRPLFFK